MFVFRFSLLLAAALLVAGGFVHWKDELFASRHLQTTEISEPVETDSVVTGSVVANRNQADVPGKFSVQPAEAQLQVPTSRHEMQLSFAPLVRETAAAVVNVYAERMVRQRSPFAGDPFFERFFGQQMPNRTRRQSSLGSGVVVHPYGIIVTNHHVIEGAQEIRIALSDGREYPSRVILNDQRVDLAVLQVEDIDIELNVLEFADSDAVAVGDLVLAIGNPFGVGQTVTSGIVSALARNQIGVGDFGFFIQTDAAINPGNSGGALIDMRGRLIGINTAIFSRSGGSNGIGFAIPANMVRAVVAAAVSGNDEFERPYIGASFEPVTSDIAEALGLPAARGALVTRVERAGPAQAGGLRPGDVVTAVNGIAVEHPDALGYRLATLGIGTAAVFDVYSGQEERHVEITLARLPENFTDDERLIEGNNPFAGARVANLSPGLADRLRIRDRDEGVVVVAVEPRSPAARFGLRPRDIVVAVNGARVSTSRELAEATANPARAWRMDIERDGQMMRQIVR